MQYLRNHDGSEYVGVTKDGAPAAVTTQMGNRMTSSLDFWKYVSPVYAAELFDDKTSHAPTKRERVIYDNLSGHFHAGDVGREIIVETSSFNADDGLDAGDAGFGVVTSPPQASPSSATTGTTSTSRGWSARSRGDVRSQAVADEADSAHPRITDVVPGFEGTVTLDPASSS